MTTASGFLFDSTTSIPFSWIDWSVLQARAPRPGLALRLPSPRLADVLDSDKHSRPTASVQPLASSARRACRSRGKAGRFQPVALAEWQANCRPLGLSAASDFGRYSAETTPSKQTKSQRGSPLPRSPI